MSPTTISSDEASLITSENIRIAPLALQMLIENAIKHNIISEENPFTIGVYTDGNQAFRYLKDVK